MAEECSAELDTDLGSDCLLYHIGRYKRRIRQPLGGGSMAKRRPAGVGSAGPLIVVLAGLGLRRARY